MPSARPASAPPSSAPPSSALPVWHDRCLETLTGLHDLAPEPKATCGDCVMCAGASRSGSAVTFAPDVKCCSHIPNLPNFLVGRELSGSGRGSVQARIGRRNGVTPFGLGVTHAEVGRVIAAHPVFGRSSEVMCPHYVTQTQGCAIWQNRNASCSTWFCQHERGAVSQRFWHAVRDLLIAAEERLAYRCVTEGGLPGEQVSAVLDHRSRIRASIQVASEAEAQGQSPVPRPRDPLDDDESPQWYARMWGEWQGREAEWFVHCAGMIDELAPGELTEWMKGVQHLVDAVHDAWDALQHAEPTLPEQLSFVPGPGSAVDGDVLRLVGYSQFDPITVPASMVGPLRLLDAGPSSPEELVDAGLLHRLLDFGVVIPRRPDSGSRDVPVTGSAPA